MNNEIENYQCKTSNCVGVQYARGLCLSCYMSALRMIKKGKITWEILEKLNRCNAQRKRGKPERSLFYESINDVLTNYTKIP